MEVRPGYKLTEKGMIPADWVVKPISQVAPLQRGFDLPARGIRPGKYPVVYSNGVENFNDVAMVKGPGVVTGRSGTLGKVHYVDSDYWPHNTSLWVTRFNDNDPKFIYYLYESLHFERFASGSGVPTLNRNDAHSYPIALPTKRDEQRAIATALSDVDALLGGLDHLIAKKRDVKQAAMQQLLTGQTRLPGFEGEWEVKRLGDIGDIKSGGTPSTTEARFWDGDLPWCTPTDITGLLGRKYLNHTTRTISASGLQSSSAEVIPPRSLIMTSRATIGECAINLIPMATNQGFKNIVPFAAVDVEFLYYLMTTQKPGLIALCGGSTFLEIGKKQVSAYEIMLPKDRAEQNAIAAVLSDMDAEVSALEARRDKTRALKQAMMQELLTGKTRLVPEGATLA
jgi:type I restriction enzyme, S subunit